MTDIAFPDGYDIHALPEWREHHKDWELLVDGLRVASLVRRRAFSEERPYWHSQIWNFEDWGWNDVIFPDLLEAQKMIMEWWDHLVRDEVYLYMCMS